MKRFWRKYKTKFLTVLAVEGYLLFTIYSILSGITQWQEILKIR